MCGIAGIHFKDPKDPGLSPKQLEDFVDLLLLGIEPRGRHATGYAVVDNRGAVSLEKADTDAANFINWRHALPKRPRTIQLHTRWATQGTPMNLDNNHPVQYESVFAIHNGHIRNDDKLFSAFELERHAEVDSEIIPALFHHFGLDKAHKALQELDGNFAVAVMDPERFPKQLVLAKGYSSPLEYIETSRAIVWASTWDAIEQACKVALNFKPSKRTCQSLKYGELLYVEGADIEKMDFQMYRSSWQTNNYTSSGTSSYPVRYAGRMDDDDWSIPYKPPSERKMCECGHTDFWHGGYPNAGKFYQGECTDKFTIEGTRTNCECKAFKEAKELPDATGFDFCDGCSKEFPMNKLVKWSNYLLCMDDCAQWTEEELSLGSEDTRTFVSVEGEDGVEAVEVITLSHTEWVAREDRIHEKALELISRETGQHVQFINWLLFDAPIEAFEDNPYLVSQHQIADELYPQAENVARQIIEAKEKMEEERANNETCGVIVVDGEERAVPLRVVGSVGKALATG
jgi:hypothetical protein